MLQVRINLFRDTRGEQKMKDSICIGMAGAGRATELHMLALDQYSGIPVRRKTIMAASIIVMVVMIIRLLGNRFDRYLYACLCACPYDTGGIRCRKTRYL